MRLDPLVRFFRHVRKTSTCWLWTGAKCRGYGTFRLSRPRRVVRAHRWLYRLDPKRRKKLGRKLLDHKCRVIACVRIAHQRPFTRRQNALQNSRSPSAINAAKTHCVRGHSLTDPKNVYRYGHTRMCRTCLRRTAKAYGRVKRLTKMQRTINGRRVWVDRGSDLRWHRWVE